MTIGDLWPVAAVVAALSGLVGGLGLIVWLVDTRARRDMDAMREESNAEILKKQRDAASAPRRDPADLLGRMRREEL